MGIKNLFKSKKQKAEESYAEMNREYDRVMERIQACEEAIDRYAAMCENLSPGSIQYRKNEREATAKIEEKKLLEKQLQIIATSLGKMDRVKQVKNFNEEQRKHQRLTDNMLGDEKDLSRTMAEVQMNRDRISETFDKVGDYGAELFEETEPDTPSTVSEFGAMVARRAREHAMMEDVGESAREGEASDEPVRTESEFDRLVNGRK